VRWSDAARLAVRQALRRRVRTALTTLGVTLGAGLLVALATITSAADTKVIDHLGNGGPIAAIKVADARPRLSQLDSDELQAAGPHDIGDADVAAMRRAPHVARVVPVMVTPVVEVPPGSPRTFNDALIGVDLTQASSLPVTVLAGRLPAPSSSTEVAATTDFLEKAGIDPARPRPALGLQVALSTAQTTPRQVRYRTFRAVVVGVVSQDFASDGDFVVPIAQTRAARAWALDGLAATPPSSSIVVAGSPYSAVVVVASGLDEVHEVRAEVAQLGYASSAPEHLVASVQEYLGVVNIVLGSIGSVALGVALLSIASALLAAIHERRRDIGVLKAIGGRDRDVLRWFLLEALAMGLAGGAAGAVAGVAIAEVVGVAVNRYLVTHGLGSLDLIGVPVLIPLAGWLGTAALAVAAGALPALTAARLPAREAVVEA
jgi:putative ABC transport system permease protein